MEYNILIETDFFNLLNAGHKNKGGNALENSYREFIKVVVDLCSTNVKQAVFALSYAETELDFHLSMPHIKDCLGTVGLYVRKAIAFVRRMQEHVAATYHLHVNTSTSEASPPVSSESKPLVKWTGNAVDLVEMVYGICVMGSVNDGEVKFKDLAQAMYQFFGIKAKDCYRFYTDIRRRKNYSRTYFLDKMQEKLNEKMRRDDELERMRISFTRLANIIASTGAKLSKPTLINYIEYSKDAFLIYPIKNIADNLTQRETNPKYYFVDNGIISILAMDIDTSLLENMVAMELLRRYGLDEQVFFYNKNIEIDFYIPDAAMAIQVSYNPKKSTETWERESTALIKLSKVLDCKRLIILTYELEEEIVVKDKKIEVIPVWKWLLDL